jgi:mRNA interferase MazF
MYKSGDIVIAEVQFIDTFEIKKRPVLLLYEEFGNFVVAGITSNVDMLGISLSKKEGMIKDSIIKTNYIFTISEKMIYKYLFTLNMNKKKIVFEKISNQLSCLIK